MPNLSKHTKSFLAVLLITFISVLTAYYVSMGVNQMAGLENLGSLPGKIIPNQKSPDVVSKEILNNQDKKPTTINPETWQTFEDPRFDITFKYPETWTLKMYQENKPNGTYIISLLPGSNAGLIRIFISESGYYAMEGLPVTATTLGGKPALNVADMLVGVKTGGKFYTFDLGSNMDFQPEFKALLSQVKFN